MYDGPEQLGAKARDDIEPTIPTLHVARHGRNRRHFVVFREPKNQCIDVLRLLHGSMDLARHIAATYDNSHRRPSACAPMEIVGSCCDFI